jgi:hypothetical protein
MGVNELSQFKGNCGNGLEQCFSSFLFSWRNPYNNCSHPTEPLPVKTGRNIYKKESVVSTRKLLQYFQLPDKILAIFRVVFIIFFCGTLKWLCTYSIISRGTPCEPSSRNTDLDHSNRRTFLIVHFSNIKIQAVLYTKVVNKLFDVGGWWFLSWCNKKYEILWNVILCSNTRNITKAT